jgi:hypothetical protein
MRTKIIAVVTMLVLAVLACGVPAVGGAKPTVTIAPIATVPATQPPATVPATQPPATVAPQSNSAAQSGSVLFHDDFSNPSSGWDQTTNSDGSTDYANGGYRILVNTANLVMWANPNQTLPNDVRIEVDATKSAGPDANGFGVICRYTDKDNFYKFIITSDGYAGISKLINGNVTVISSPDGKIQTVNNINKGAASNHIRADCIGSTLTLYVNGNQVATASDSSLSGGDTGLFAQTYDTGGVDILFHDFNVYAP